MLRFFFAVASVALLFANVFLAEPNKPNTDSPMVLAIGELDECIQIPKMPMRPTMSFLRLDPMDGDMYVNTTLVFEEPLDDPITLRFEFYKCLAKEVDSCSLQTFTEQSTVCGDINKKGMVWSSIIERIQGFEPKCPVPAGKYKLVDGPVTKAIRESGVKFDQGHWRIKSKLIKNGTMVGCVWGYGEIKPKRRERSPKSREPKKTRGK